MQISCTGDLLYTLTYHQGVDDSMHFKLLSFKYHTVMKKLNYITPEIEVIEVEIEKGFANSLENPEDGGISDW